MFIAVCPQLHSASQVFLASSPPDVPHAFSDPQHLYDVVLGNHWILDPSVQVFWVNLSALTTQPYHEI